MIKDEDLKSTNDYSKGQKEVAHRVLIELVNLFHDYEDDIRIVGGWVPDLMFPNKNHVGSIDVDILINHLKLQDAGYLSMSRILQKHGYIEHPDKYFSYLKIVEINGINYPVDVDILAGIYGGTTLKKRSQHVQGIKALKATGGNFAFEFPPQQIEIEASRPDGAIDFAKVNVVAIVPYLVMKSAALGRGKPKDAYDIYFVIKHYNGGVKELAKSFDGLTNLPTIQNMKSKLNQKFKSVNHSGCQDVVNFLDIQDSDEIEFLKRDVYEQIQALLQLI